MATLGEGNGEDKSDALLVPRSPPLEEGVADRIALGLREGELVEVLLVIPLKEGVPEPVELPVLEDRPEVLSETLKEGVMVPLELSVEESEVTRLSLFVAESVGLTLDLNEPDELQL